MYGAWKNCQACRLHELRTQVVFGDGSLDAKIMVVDGAPSKLDDKFGVPLVSTQGNLLLQFLAETLPLEPVAAAQKAFKESRKGGDNQEIKEAAHNLRAEILKEVFLIDAVMCLPLNVEVAMPGRETPTRDADTDEIKACRSRLHEMIYIVDPKIIIAVGGVALSALTGSKKSILSSRGSLTEIEIQGRTRPIKYSVMPILHPSYLMKINAMSQVGDGKDADKTYNDILTAVELAYSLEANLTNRQMPAFSQKTKI